MEGRIVIVRVKLKMFHTELKIRNVTHGLLSKELSGTRWKTCRVELGVLERVSDIVECYGSRSVCQNGVDLDLERRMIGCLNNTMQLVCDSARRLCNDSDESVGKTSRITDLKLYCVPRRPTNYRFRTSASQERFEHPALFGLQLESGFYS